MGANGKPERKIEKCEPRAWQHPSGKASRKPINLLLNIC
jgi:hypothetical protein